ncbi:MAG: methyltransferase [Longimicrobiales bacterium]
MTVMSQEATADLVLRKGTREQFERLRRLLEDVGYTTALVNERRGMLAFDGEPPQSPVSPTSALDVLVFLFLDGTPVASPIVFEHLPSELLELLRVFGLLQYDQHDGTTCSAPLALYPTGGVYVVSDHRTRAIGREDEPMKDLVYPALSTNTAEFLILLPTKPCESLLDLGAGSGVAALIGAANYAGHAWAADVTARATRVAEFNVELNGLSNVTVLHGDLYEPLSGRRFERIVSHPPYMPANENGLIFRDGGEDGEELIRRIIAGLPDHLRPGGRFYCRCMATDRKNAPLERRVRDLLGETRDEFDVLVITKLTFPIGPYLCNSLVAGTMAASEYAHLLRMYRHHEAENVVIGFVVIERHAAPRPPITARRPLPSGADPDSTAIDWLHERERAVYDPAVRQALYATRPYVSVHASIEMTHRVHEGTLRADACAVTSRFPFGFRMEAPPGVAMLLGHCDGNRTVAELEARMRDVGVIGSDTSTEEFIRIVQILVGGGVLESVEFPLPARA